MNENTSKVVEYVLVILIALGVSYAVFAQAKAYEDRFGTIESSIKALQTKIDAINVDNIINQIYIKGLTKDAAQQNAPVVVEPTTPTETPAPAPAPTAPTPAPVR
jgi:hypothetical protein